MLILFLSGCRVHCVPTIIESKNKTKLFPNFYTMLVLRKIKIGEYKDEKLDTIYKITIRTKNDTLIEDENYWLTYRFKKARYDKIK